MYIKIILCSLFLIYSSNWKKIQTIDTKDKILFVDNLQNIYQLKNNTLTKTDALTKQVFNYSNKQLGEISFVDLFDPMTPTLFYQNQSILVILDNTLSIQNESINLLQNNLNTPTLFCRGANNTFWLYTPDNNELIRLSNKLKPLLNTGNLNWLLRIKLQPDFMQEINNKIYLNNPKNGILMFDQYGTYIKTIQAKNAKNITITDKNIYYSSASSLFKYNIKTFETDTISLPTDAFNNIVLIKNKMYIQNDSTTVVYEFKE